MRAGETWLSGGMASLLIGRRRLSYFTQQHPDRLLGPSDSLLPSRQAQPCWEIPSGAS